MPAVPAPGRSLLALDLDGTVIDLDLRLDPQDLEALDRTRVAGWAVVACTGRPFPGALPWARRLGLTEPIVCYQGAQVRGLDGEVLWEKGVPRDLAMEVVELCRGRDLHVQAYHRDRLLVERDRPEARAYAAHAGMEITYVPDLEVAMGPLTPKLVVVAAEGVIAGLMEEARERWRGRLNVATSMPTYLEMTSPHADKARALEFLARRLGCHRSRVVAVGDGRNDLSMIRWAGLGVAVEGSPRELVEAAARLIPPPGRGGIRTLVDSLL